MMRYLKILFLSMAIVGLIAVQAGALVNNDGLTAGFATAPGIRTLAIERVSPTTGYTDDYSHFNTRLTAATAAGQSISFSLSGGATFTQPTQLKLCFIAVPGTPHTATDVQINAAPTTISGDNTSISYTLAGAQVLNDVLYISKTCNVPVAGDLYINIPAAMTSTSVLRMAAASSVAADAADTDTIYTGFQQFTLAACPAGIGNVIDVNKDLKLFDVAAPNDVRSRWPGPPGFAVINNAGTIVALNFASSQATITLTGDMTGISSIQLVNVGATTVVGTFAIGTNTATATIGLPGIIAAGALDILITINNTTVKDDRPFNIGMTVSTGNDIVQGVTLLNPNVVFAGAPVPPVCPGSREIAWATNGVQFIVAYMRHDASLGISSSIRVENVCSATRNYWLLVNNPSTGTWTMIKSKVPIAAGSTTVLLGSGIMADALLATTPVTLPATGFATRVVVDELNNAQNVAAFATQFITGYGYRNLEVLKNAGWFD